MTNKTDTPTHSMSTIERKSVMQRLCTQCAAGVGITKTSYELLSEACFPSSSLSFTTLPFTPLLPAGSPECITSSKPQFMKTHSLQLAFSLEPHEDFGSYCIKKLFIFIQTSWLGMWTIMFELQVVSFEQDFFRWFTSFDAMENVFGFLQLWLVKSKFIQNK